MATPKVKTVPLDTLLADAGNVRAHDERNRDLIRSSLERLGAARSIVIDKDNIVRAGNGTLEAAAAAGITDVIVVETTGNELVAVKRPDWTEPEAREYGVLDNRATDLSSFVDGKLAQALRDAEGRGVSLADMGYTESEFERICESAGDDLPNGSAGAGAGVGDGTHPNVETGKYGLIVQCQNEAHQQELYDRLTAEGLEVRVVCV